MARLEEWTLALGLAVLLGSGCGGGASGGGPGGGGGAEDWTLSTGANPEDLVEAVTFAHTVAVDFTTGKISYTDPRSGAAATADLPAAGSVVVALASAPVAPATITFARDPFGHTITAALPAGQHLELVLSGRYVGSLTLDSDRKLALSLAGLTIDSPDGPAIHVASRKRTFVVLQDGTANTLSDSGADASTPWSARTLPGGAAARPRATFFAEGPLVFSAGPAGTGALTVRGLRKAALGSDAHLRVRGGTLTLTAAGGTATDGEDGIHARQAFVMDGGAVTVEAACGDGVQVEGEEDGALPLGFVVVNGGTLAVRASGHGIQASFDPADPGAASTATTADDPDPFLLLNGGTVSVTTTGAGADALRARSWLTVNGGILHATTTGPGSARGIQAGSAVTVHGGALTVSTASPSAEGVKCTAGPVTVDGGTLEIAAGEDGIAAETEITIRGGASYVHGGGGEADGLDANGAVSIAGGLLVVVGSGEAPGEALDAGRAVRVTGGTFVAVGGAAVGGAPATATVDAVRLVFSRDAWTREVEGTLLVVGATAAPLLTYQLPALATNEGIAVLLRHPGLVAGTTYAVSTGAGSAAGGAFHGLYAGEGTTVSGAWTERGSFTATGGLVTRTF